MVPSRVINLHLQYVNLLVLLVSSSVHPECINPNTDTPTGLGQRSIKDMCSSADIEHNDVFEKSSHY